MNVAENKERDLYLFPPPRLLPNGEMPPVIEPPLRDMLPFPGAGHVEGWEHFESGEDERAFTPDLTRHAAGTAMRDERVIKLLEGKRHIAIGVSRRETREKGEGRRITLVSVYYNYDDNSAIEVTLDSEGGTVLGVQSGHFQPAPLQSEIDHAIRLAVGHEKLAAHVTDDLVANAILVSDHDPASPGYNHRLFDVRFFCPEERLARHMAIVDLSTEEVVRAGSCRSEGCCGGHAAVSEGTRP
jgi:hypothetical protein